MLRFLVCLCDVGLGGSINGGLSPLLSPMKHAHSQGSDVHRFSFEMPQQHGLQVRHEAMRPGNGANPAHEQAVFPQDAAQKVRLFVQCEAYLRYLEVGRWRK